MPLLRFVIRGKGERDQPIETNQSAPLGPIIWGDWSMKVVLVDTNNLANRYSVLNLSFGGEKTGILYSLIRLMRRICAKERPSYLIWFADNLSSPMTDKQHEVYPQILSFFHFLHILKVNYVIAEPGIPADYYLASAVNYLKENQKMEILIYSNDHDFLQLVDNRTRVVKSVKEDKVYDLEVVREEYQMEPYQLLDYWALIGDATDGIGGIKGIGKKRGKELILEYGDLLGALSFLETKERYRGCTEAAWKAYNEINLLEKNIKYKDRFPSACRHLYENDFDVTALDDFFRHYGLALYCESLKRGRLFLEEGKGIWN